MDVSAIPFNRFLGLRAGDTALTLPADPKYHNHLGTVHAGAQFSLAEAASGQWLLDRFGEGHPLVDEILGFAPEHLCPVWSSDPLKCYALALQSKGQTRAWVVNFTDEAQTV